jgi:fatty acid desaturase
VSEYVWGGMQYQLEHHLFPTMPRYKYRRLAPVVQQWAQENGLQYR